MMRAIWTAAAAGLALMGLVGCGAPRPLAAGVSGAGSGTRVLDERSGLIRDDQGRAVSAETLRAEQQRALAAGPARGAVRPLTGPGSGFKGWLREWYSPENIQKRMALGAAVGLAAQHDYGRARDLSAPLPPVMMPPYRTQSEDGGFYANDGYHRRIGSTWYHPDGSTSRMIGNTLYNSDGGTTRQIGNSYFHSDGGTTQKIGNSYFHSDGSVTNRIGNTLYTY